MTLILALIRGQTKREQLTDALDKLKVRKGEHFLIASQDALKPIKPGHCVCGRPLFEQDKLFEQEPNRPQSDDAILAG